MAQLKTPSKTTEDVGRIMRGLLFGQDAAIDTVLEYVQIAQAGLNVPDRPAGVFLLIGPTGTGKTKTVEALAEALHGNKKAILKVDCGEFQMEHEVAKLIGAPPGYLGHRETQPMLTQQKLSAVTSESSTTSLLLFDEIEKAAPSMARLLLGVLDKATLRLGDNSTVNFERTLIFMTSNLGADAMRKVLCPDFGFEAMVGTPDTAMTKKLVDIGKNAVQRKFSPEFVNRIDATVTYQPLDDEANEFILNAELDMLEGHIQECCNFDAAMTLLVSDEARTYMLTHGINKQSGARELKRLLFRQVLRPVAALKEDGKLKPGIRIQVHSVTGQALSVYPLGPKDAAL